MSKFFARRTLQDWKPGDMPAKAGVAIGIAEHHTLRNGDHVISAELMTESEIDYAIDGLIAELENVRREAKRALRADNAKVDGDASSRRRGTSSAD